MGGVDHEGMLRGPLPSSSGSVWNCLPVVGRKPHCHLPCHPGGPFSWRLWAQLLRDGHSCPVAPTWHEERSQGDEADEGITHTP